MISLIARTLEPDGRHADGHATARFLEAISRPRLRSIAPDALRGEPDDAFSHKELLDDERAPGASFATACIYEFAAATAERTRIRPAYAWGDYFAGDLAGPGYGIARALIYRAEAPRAC